MQRFKNYRKGTVKGLVAALAGFGLCVSLGAVAAEPVVDLVRVDKSQRKLFLISAGNVVREFSVALGGEPPGHKQQEGDQRTPEGRYLLDFKKADSAYYKAIHVSYPSGNDAESARKRGVSPGGAIMIHGQKNGFGWLGPLMQRFDWTDGCIALLNEEMEEVWRRVPVDTPIEINP